MDWRTIQFYAEHLGWPLFPCSNRTKAPLTPHGFYDATTDLRQLEAWDKAYPDAAWGTPTSAERGVIDIDPRNGGELSLNRLIAEYGPLPPTPTVRTGSGGFHYWFRFPPGTGCGKPYPGIDRKAIGGYVIVPPSRIDIPEHEGRAYAWEDGCKPWEGVPYAEAPAWSVGVAPLAAPHGGNGAADADDPWIVRASNPDLLTHPGSSHGERRETFCQLAGIHLARGDSEASVRAMAEAWAMRCTPTFDGKPNPDDHWEKHLAGLLAKEAAKAMKMTTPHAPLPYTVSVSIAEDRSDTILSPEGRKEGRN